MKLGAKKISLISVTAMWIFFGIFGLAKASASDADRFDKIVIKNSIKYAVTLGIGSKGNDQEKYVVKDFSINAGEKKEFLEEDVLLGISNIWINPISENQNLIFLQGYRGEYRRNSEVIRFDVIEEDRVLGDLTVLVRKADRILYVTIDSRDGDVQYESEEGLCGADTFRAQPRFP